MATFTEAATSLHDAGPGGICGDCGHFACRHSGSECEFWKLDPERYKPCGCKGMLWEGQRLPMNSQTGPGLPVTTFFVPGVPAPQGSKNPVGGGRMVEASKGLQAWRWRIGLAANQARHGGELLSDAVSVRLSFVLPRPKALAGRVTPTATKPPDLDKLSRAVFDALTGTLWTDDDLVVELVAYKRIAEPAEQPGVEIHVEPFAESLK